MIAVSDAVLVLVSATILATGLYRWQNNVDQLTNNSPRTAVITQSPQTGNDSASAQAKPVAGTQSPTAENSSQSATLPAAQNPNATVSADVAQGQSERTAAIDASDSERLKAIEALLADKIAEKAKLAAGSNNTSGQDASLYGSYTVRSGDSLSQIAFQLGTTITDLQSINDLDGTLIKVGQRLRYPLPAN